MKNVMLGYMCQQDGFQHNCDIDSESGERLCEDCGNEVTGLKGRTRGRRAPPEGEPMKQSGDIGWIVEVKGGQDLLVYAFDYERAIKEAIDSVGNPQNINRVLPRKRKYRG